MTLGALIKFWLSQMRRDRRIIACLALFALAPHVLAWSLEHEWAVSASFLTLLLPIPVGWLWGEELAAGRLVLLVLAGSSMTRIYIACQLAVIGVTLPFALLTTVYVPPWEAGLVMAQSVLMVEVGFLFVTFVASADAGWLPLLLAALGVWTPLIFLVHTTSQGARLPMVIKVVVTVFLPQIALLMRMGSYAWVMITLVVSILTTSVLAWIGVHRRAFRRQSR